jgi:hypothetical protein
MAVPGRMIVLWMSELTWAMAEQIPAVRALQTRGATVTTLEPLPITGQQTQAQQMFSGQNPGRTGYFDSWTPWQYAALSTTEPTVRTLHEVIVATGHTSVKINLTLAEVSARLDGWTQPMGCLIVQTVAGDDIAAMDQAIMAALTWAGTDGICVLLSDRQAAPVNCYVNFNDGLRDLGVLEVSEQGTICWEASLAYHVGYGQLWINLEGREPTGIVTPGEEYDQVCQALVTSLPAKILDPRTGQHVIERIYRRSELYKGHYLFRAPDLVVVLRAGYAPSPNSISLGFDGAPTWIAPAGTSTTAGLHPDTVAGLAIAVGAPFNLGRIVARAPLMNIAPTLLYALRLPIPRSMDAEVISGLFMPSYIQQFPVQWTEQDFGLSAEDEEEILVRLKSLGYVE